MEVRVRQVDGVKFSVQSRSHTVLCDQPAENGGQDSGMTPPEFLLASLGSCAAFYAVQYLKARKLALGGVEVSVTAEKLKQPGQMALRGLQNLYAPVRSRPAPPKFPP